MSISSRIRLLIKQSPREKFPLDLLQEYESHVGALFVPFGETIASGADPPSSVALVVEGGLRVAGLDASGNEFTLRRISEGEWWGAFSVFNSLPLPLVELLLILSS